MHTQAQGWLGWGCAPDPLPRSWFGHHALFVVSWLEVGRLFEDIQKRSRAIDSVALRIAHPFYDTRTFQSFDGALHGRKGPDRAPISRGVQFSSGGRGAGTKAE